MNFIDWNLLVRDRETGKTVWQVSGVEKSKVLWTATILRDIQPHVARIVCHSNPNKQNSKIILEELKDHGFSRIYSLRGSRVKWHSEVDSVTTSE